MGPNTEAGSRWSPGCAARSRPGLLPQTGPRSFRVSDGTRTRGILDHNQVLYQLSYTHHDRSFSRPAEKKCTGSERVLAPAFPAVRRGPLRLAVEGRRALRRTRDARPVRASSVRAPVRERRGGGDSCVARCGGRPVRGGCGGDRPSGARRAVWAPVPGGAPTPGSHLRVQAVCAPGSAPGSGGSVHGSPHRGAGGPVPDVSPDRAREAPGRRPGPPGWRGRSRQEDVPGGAGPGKWSDGRRDDRAGMPLHTVPGPGTGPRRAGRRGRCPARRGRVTAARAPRGAPRSSSRCPSPGPAAGRRSPRGSSAARRSTP